MANADPPTDIRLSLIVAVAENGVIGRDGGLPWRQSSDLKTFRRLTMGKPMIMGRRTFESIGKPLDGRDNIVVSRDPCLEIPGASVVATVDDAVTLARVLARTRGADEIMVIGGAALYDATLSLADRIYLTRIEADVAGDRYFPTPDAAQWREAARETIPQGPKDDHQAALVTYDRVQAGDRMN